MAKLLQTNLPFAQGENVSSATFNQLVRVLEINLGSVDPDNTLQLTTAERDTLNFNIGQIIYNTSTTTLQYWDGSTFQNISSTGAVTLNITDGSSNIAIDLFSETLSLLGGTGITSTASGNGVTFAIDSTVATLVGSQTLTNKTIDVDNNTLSNIEVDNFKASAIVTESEGIASNDNDTTLPTSAAVKDFVDTQITAEDLDVTDGSSNISIDLDSEVLGILGGTGLTSSASGNNVTLSVDASQAQITTVGTLDSGAISSGFGAINIGSSALTAGTGTFSSNVTISGDLTVSGTTTSINTTNLEVKDKNITLNFGAGDTSSNANGAGITIQDAVDASTDATILWNTTADRFDFSHGLRINADAQSFTVGASGDFSLSHNGTNTFMANNTGIFYITQNTDDANFLLRADDGSGGVANYITLKGSTGEVILGHYGNNRFKTTTNGVDVLNGGLFVGGTEVITSARNLSNIGSINASGNIVGTANLQIDTDTFVVVASNNSVGIGTDSPTSGSFEVNLPAIYKDTATFEGNTVFNEASSANADFRVESDSNTHALFVDSSTNRVGILNSTPSTVLDVTGGIKGTSLNTTGKLEVVQSTTGSASGGIRFLVGGIADSDGNNFKLEAPTQALDMGLQSASGVEINVGATDTGGGGDLSLAKYNFAWSDTSTQLTLTGRTRNDANVSVNRTAYNLFVDGDDTGFIDHTFFDSVSIKSGISGTALGTLRLFEASNNGTNYVALRSPSSLSSNVTFTLPSADGSANQILKTDGAGNLSFVTESAATTINNNAANRVITGSGSANTLNAQALLTFGNSTGSASDSSLEISGGSSHPPVLSLLNTTGSSTTDFATISHDGANAVITARDGSSRGGIKFQGTTGVIPTLYGGFDSSGNFEIGSTDVIDASRNLTNIGTISSGALSVTSDTSSFIRNSTDNDLKFTFVTNNSSDFAQLIMDGKDGGSEKFLIAYGSTHSSTPNMLALKSNDSSAGAIGFFTNSTERARFDVNGRLGINTNAPAEKLHINGSSSEVALRIDTTNADPKIRLTTLGQQDWSIGVDYSDSGKFKINESGNVGTLTALTIDANRNVGIGTVSPNFLLDVEGTGSTLARLNSTSGSALFQISVPDTTSICDINFGDTGHSQRGQIRYRHNGDSLAFSTAQTEALRIDSSQRVGIGTTAPGQALDVRSAANIQLKLASTTSSNNSRMVFAPNNTEFWNIGTNISNGQFTFFDVVNSTTPFRLEAGAGNNTLVVDSNSRVGIGTNAPSFELEVAGNIGMDNKLYHNDDHNTYIEFTADTQIFRTGGTDRVTINNTGLGIGTTSPATKLDVNGTSTFRDDVTFTGASANILYDSSANNLEFQDTAKASFGTDNDLLIYHDSLSIIEDVGTNGLEIRTNGPDIRMIGGSNELMAKFVKDGAVELYHDNVKRLETTSSGVSMTNGLVVEGTTTFNDDANFTAALQIGGTTVTSTAAELNKLDGFTGTVADLNYAKDLRATGVTATEFDFLDGVTSNIQTQIDAISTVTINNNADNRLITGSGTANTLNGEANLTFDGATLEVIKDGATAVMKVHEDAGSSTARFHIRRGTVDTFLQHRDSNFEIRTENNISTSNTPAMTIDTGGNIVAGYNLAVSGNLTVSGTTTTVDTTNTNVKDNNLTLNYSTGDSSSTANGAGLTIQDAVSASTDATLLWDSTNDKFDFSHSIQVPDNAKAFFGTGNDLEIFHNGTNSVINDAGTGDLIFQIAGSEKGRITSTAFSFQGGYSATGSFNTSLGAYQINGTTVIDSSRNLTNIGTISSGAITSSGLVTADELSVTNDSTFNGGLDINGDATFGDNNKAIFGAGSDLQIYHDGNHSYIQDSGTGRLRFKASTQIDFLNGAGTETLANFIENDAVKLYFNNALKLTTTSTGIDVTGLVKVTDQFQSISGSRTLVMNANFSGLGAIGMSSNDHLTFVTNNTERMRLDNSGNVGIGTNSPAQKLHVEGNLRLQSTFPKIEFVDTDNNPDFTIIGGSGRLGFFDETNSSERMRLDSSGRLGIGTTSPADKLHVNGDFRTVGSTYAIRLAPSSGAGPILQFGTTSDTDAYGTIAQQASQFKFTTFSRDFNFNNNGTTNLHIDVSEVAVGINTSSPTSKLNIDTGSDQGIAIFRTGTNANFDAIQFRKSNNSDLNSRIGFNENQLRLDGTNDILFGTGGSYTERMRINASGRVGIGTDSPSLALEVNDTSNVDGEQISIKGSASYGGTVVFRRGDSFNWRVGVGGGSSTNSTIPSSFFGFEQGNTLNLAIAHTTGNVGINTSNPAVKLDVVGDARMKASSDSATALTLKRNSSSGRSQFALTDESDNQLWRVGLTGAGGEDFVFYDGGANVLILDRSSNASNFGGNIQMGGTTVIDSSRNLTNIGSYSGTGEITTSKTGNAITTSANAAVFAHGFTSGSRGFNFESGDESVGTIRFDANTMRFWSGGAGGGNERIRINDAATDQGDINFYGSIDLEGVNLRSSGTNVLDSSRNLQNINSLSMNTGIASAVAKTFSLPNTSGNSDRYIKFGTLSSLSQSGQSVTLRIHSNVGYNASNAQNQETLVRFKTSNGSSNQSGFYGDCQVYYFGSSTGAPSSVVVKQVSTTEYEFYGVFGNFTGTGSFYTVEHRQGTWTNSATDTGTSAPTGTVLTATERVIFTSGTTNQSQTLQAGSFSIGSTSVIDGSRNLTNIGTISSGAITSSSDVTINNKLISSGDTNTYLQFQAADSFRVVTGGSQRLGINNTATTVLGQPFIVSAPNSAEIKFFQTTSSTTASKGSIQWFDSGSNSCGTINLKANGAENNSGIMEFYVTAESDELGDDPFGMNKPLILTDDTVQVNQSTLFVGKTAQNTATTGIEARNGGFFSATRANAIVAVFNRTTSDGALIAFRRNNTTVGSVSVTTSATTYNTTSDARLKDVTGYARGLKVINKLNPVAFNWKADGKADEGLIAQEVEKIVPNAVNIEEDYYQMDYSKLVTPLIKAVQEQQEQIEKLEKDSHSPKGLEDMDGYKDLLAVINDLKAEIKELKENK